MASALPTRGTRGPGLEGECSRAKPLTADLATGTSVFCPFECMFPINEFSSISFSGSENTVVSAHLSPVSNTTSA